MERRGEKIFCVTRFHDLTCVHNGDFIRQFAGGGNIMGDEDESCAEFLLDALEHVHDVGLREQVEGGGRLIEDDQAGAGDERHRQRHALAHPAAQLKRIAIQEILGHAHMLEHFADQLECFCFFQAQMDHGWFGNLVTHFDDGVERVHGSLRHQGYGHPAHVLTEFFFIDTSSHLCPAG